MRWTWPRIERRTVLMWLAAVIAFGLWQGTTVWFALRADGSALPGTRPYLWEITGALSAFVVSWIPLTAVVNAPRPAGRWPRFLAIHVAGYVAYAVLHAAIMIGARFPLYRALGWGTYDYAGGSAAFRLAMEASKDVVIYLLLTVGFGLLMAWRDGQRRALREARLATELRDTQLRALVGQLNPHFLFNALNTISAVMYTDLARTDRLLADLGEVLRAGLTADRGPTWSLADERVHTEHFLAVMLARFGDRLRVHWQVDDAAQTAQLPRFTLQLLVENAIKHNQDARAPLDIAIAARRAPGAVELEVVDNGRGFGGSPAAGLGTGLATLRQALALYHGPAAALEVGNGAGGGARVRLRVPVEAA